MQSQPFLPDISKANAIIPEAGRVSVLDGNILTRPGFMEDPFLPPLEAKSGINLDGRGSVLDGISTRDMRSRASINTRDVRSRVSVATRDVKSRASSRRQNSGYYRKGRVDLSSEFRELLTKRLNAGFINHNQKKKHHTPRMQALMEDLPKPPALTGTNSKLGQLFTVLRPTVPENITLWPRDVLSKKFYSAHDQRHAFPKSLEELESGLSASVLLNINPTEGVAEKMAKGGKGETGTTEIKMSATSKRAVTSASTNHSEKSAAVATLTNEQMMQPFLEELYKDKKFLDKLIKYTLYGSDERIFAEKGRDFLQNRAQYWAKQGRLPSRPPATNLGLQLQRMRTVLA